MKSDRDEDRVFAARSLGTLGCTSSEEVVMFLAERLNQETSRPCRYEIAKSIVSLGNVLCLALYFFSMPIQPNFYQQASANNGEW